MKILLTGVMLVLLATPVIAQENPEENMVGLTCGQILAMKSDDWAE